MKLRRIVALISLLVLALVQAQSEEPSTASPEVEKPLWQTLPLVDAATGESFTLSDLAGKVVFVETFATWCSSCRRQLNNVTEAQSMIEADIIEDFAFVIVSVEGNLSNEALLEYAQNNEYKFTFSVASEEMIRALVEEFGRSIVNPPSTPHFVVKADGSYTELLTGIEPADSVWVQLLSIYDETIAN